MKRVVGTLMTRFLPVEMQVSEVLLGKGLLLVMEPRVHLVRFHPLGSMVIGVLLT